MKRLITYWDYRTKTAKSEIVMCMRYDELLDKVKELLGDTGELISIVRHF